MFIATHDYVFAKYVEIKMQEEEDDVLFHSLYKTNDNEVKCETEKKFTFLENNILTQENINLYEAEVGKVLG